MIENILHYYKDIANHNRVKINFLIGFYVALTQALMLTPISMIKAFKVELLAQQSFFATFSVATMPGIIFFLLFIGICHHLCNFIAASTQRIVYEARCIYADYQLSADSWDSYLVGKTRDRRSISKFSGMAGAVCLILFFLSAAIRLGYVMIEVFGKDNGYAYFIMGVLALFHGIALFFYSNRGIQRAIQFYNARDILRYIEGRNDPRGLAELLKRKLEMKVAVTDIKM